VAGIIGPAIVGIWFDIAGSKRGLFVLLAVFLGGAFALFAKLAPGFGEAEIELSVLNSRGLPASAASA
jgi:hypothetical protein